ncbi:proteasome maturation protein-like [Halichondria panicea]|uniref:proteasome maturation protein-like n=1 Tax=Halichondria panicea TaxID=6063 RepID=UPI00312B80C8
METIGAVGVDPKGPSSVVEKSTGAYGVHDTLRYGFASAKTDIIPPHPLEHAQATFELNREAVQFQTLRHTQGLHAPLKLQMERKLTSKIQRLPPFESSMIAFDTLTGNDSCLPLTDVLGGECDISLNVDTHVIMERRLKFDKF